MTTETTEKKQTTRRDFLKGAGAGAVVGAVVVAGVEEGIRIPGLPSKTSTSTSTKTITGGTTTSTTTATTTATATTTKTVVPPAVTVALAATPGTVSAGSSVTLTATPSGGTSPYTISIACGDGSTLTASGSHTYTAGGNYTALVTVTDSNGMQGYGTATVMVTGAPTPVPPVASKVVTLTVNGNPETLLVQANWSLLEVLREQLHLFSVKDGCSLGECGACTVMMDGMAVNSCQILAIEAEGHAITTLEGLSNYGNNLDPLQTAWLTYEGSQCGYCTPGMIMQAKALLTANPNPTMAQIQQAISGNMCCCGNYRKIEMAIASVGGS